MRIKKCFIIEGGDIVWVEIICSAPTLLVRVIGREPLFRSRVLSKTFDRYIRRAVGSRDTALEELRLRGRLEIKAYKRINNKLYVVLEIGSRRIYVPSDEEDLVKRCIKSFYHDKAKA